MSVLSGVRGLLAQNKPLTILAVTFVVVLATVAALVAAPWSEDPGDELAAVVNPGDRVLQSVDVTMAPDGSLTDIEGTVVAAPQDGGASRTRTASYAPDEVADELPVRVLTSYRTDDATGTDLGDLAGHDGRVQIDLTVQNLTVKPQEVTYDVAGTSRSRSAMVGVPLTVVASAALEDTDASAVVTRAGSAGGAVTNGVLSATGDKTTQVQWASILAPPQLDSSVTLRLVVDAEDFTPPAFDLSVQPGLVTDPSLGALVDAAFNPALSNELELQSRTIEVIGDVNTVLARASKTISGVRATLQSASSTLGVKTVQDLKASTQQISSSMRSLDGTVKSLGEDLSSSLGTTGSSILAQLDDTVSAVDSMLGDTSASAPKVTLKGEGCDQTVSAPTRPESLYANLLQVVGQLDGYAAATDACKLSLQQAILDTVGPAEPTPEACVETSVTCSLDAAEGTFVDIAEDLVRDGTAALEGLDSSKIDKASESVEKLTVELAEVVTAVEELLNNDPLVLTHAALEGVLRTDLPNVVKAVNGVDSAVDDVHDDAVAAGGDTADMQKQNDLLAAELCGLLGDSTQPNTLSKDQVDRLRSYLKATECDGATELRPPGDLRFKGVRAMETQIAEQAAAWQEVAAATDTADASQGVGLALAQLRTEIGTVRDKVQEAYDSLETGSGSIDDAIAAVESSVNALDKTLKELQAGIGGVKGGYDEAIAEMTAAFQSAGDAALVKVRGSIDEHIRKVSEQGKVDSRQLGEMFQRSVAGMNTAAETLRADGKTTLDAQRREFLAEQGRAARSTTQGIEAALSLISSGVSSSTRDMGAAEVLLVRDLTNVLLDLGERKVRGSGLLGAMATSASTANSADYQLALATDKASSYANVRGQDVAGIQLRQAQAEAALRRQAELPAFALDLPAGTEHRTVYLFHIQAGK